MNLESVHAATKAQYERRSGELEAKAARLQVRVVGSQTTDTLPSLSNALHYEVQDV